MTALPIRHPFTINEYHRMREARVFAEDDRIELLDGEIIKMAPIGPRHAACVDRLLNFLIRKLGDAAIARSQNPIELSWATRTVCADRRLQRLFSVKR